MIFKYSVIIPHYNSEVELKKLLESIPDQNYIEVIVIDDRSSTDDFRKVVQNSVLKNITSYINEGVKGAGAARNIGLDKAKGQYLLFADSDDFFTDNAFKYIEEAVSTAPEVDIIFLNVTSQKANGELGIRHINISSLVSNYIRKSGKYYSDMIRFTHNGPAGKVIKRSFIRENQIRFDETIVANDGMFSLKAGKCAKKIKVFDKTIYCITQSNDSLTRQKNVDYYRVRLEVFVRYYNFLTPKERKKVQVSPLPMLLSSKDYGVKEIFRSVLFLKKNDISLLKNLPLSTKKLKMLFLRLTR